MFSQLVTLVVGIVIGQEANIPLLRPVLQGLYVKFIESFNSD